MNWISCEDSMPEHNVCVDVWFVGGDTDARICNCFFDSATRYIWKWSDDMSVKINLPHGVTHWMPLPEPPEPVNQVDAIRKAGGA